MPKSNNDLLQHIENMKKKEDVKRAEELSEDKEDTVSCEYCGTRLFYVYITTVVDDARIYCANCKRSV